MVDFRPLLFVNALALMLLVTAGYASIQQADVAPVQQATADPLNSSGAGEASETQQPSVNSPVVPDDMNEPEPEIAKSGTEIEPSPELGPEPELAPADSRQQLATLDAGRVESSLTRESLTDNSAPQQPPQDARSVVTEVAADEPAKPVAPPPSTASLTLRSNVFGDQVTINGESHGSTRLELELDPGRYDVVISKNGFKPWQQTIEVDAGDDLTLRGRLEAYTRVNFTNGTWVGGVKTGDGTYSDDTGLRYEGGFVNGEFHGTGTAWYADGGRYEGDWEEGRRSGEGTYRGPDGSTYTGQFEADQFHGQGTLTRANGDVLTGTWAKSQLNGHGSLTTADGILYVGGFRNDRFHGEGSITEPEGTSYEGEFSNGKYHGKGSQVLSDGKKYQGEYVDGRFHGKGLLLNPNGSSIESTFKHGEPYGQVKLTTPEGEVFRARTSEPGVCYREKSYRATQCPPLEGW